MNMKELEEKHKELGKEIERMSKAQQTPEYENDEIFLLSAEEYQKYKEKIPTINALWWLRSPGNFSNLTTYVYYYGVVDSSGNYVYNANIAVRPALRTNLINDLKNKKLGNWFDYLGIRWLKLDKDLYISEMPIVLDKFDDESNSYDNSYIRTFLLDWLKNREEA